MRRQVRVEYGGQGVNPLGNGYLEDRGVEKITSRLIKDKQVMIKESEKNWVRIVSNASQQLRSN
jgi:hypothetical protein